MLKSPIVTRERRYRHMGGLAELPGTADNSKTSDPEDTPPSQSLAVILPVFNEEPSIAATIESLQNQSLPPGRIVVCDAASTDHTVPIARSLGVEVLQSNQPGRGNQIGWALRQIEQDLVLVAHADMIFPPTAVEAVIQLLTERPDVVGGCLGHRFHTPFWGSRFVETADRWRARLRGISYGDQAQFFRRTPVVNGGGFPLQPLMEDIELSRLLKRLGKQAYLDCPVTVSSRRFVSHGLLRTVLFNGMLRVVYRCTGIAGCQRLHRWYYGSRFRSGS